MKIAIASGKGGTGKSTISTNLAYLLSQHSSEVELLDCDVEEPNCHIFLSPEFQDKEKINISIPEIDEEKCIKCGKCAEVCQFNALAFIKDKVLKFPELCHGCGSCTLTCKANAIKEAQREVGELALGKASGFKFTQGELRIGEAMSPPLIKAVKSSATQNLQIFDCPPGTSCPAIAAISDVDFVFMVTEPTPFGLYDLKLAVDVVKKLNLPFGIVINRSSHNDKLIEDYALDKNIKILTRIPDSRKVAECYSRGELILKELPEFKKFFEPLLDIVNKGAQR